MASGRSHERINLSVFTLLAGGHLYQLYQQHVAPYPLGFYVAFVSSYLIGSLWITPDLDLANCQVQPKRRWGKWGWLWVLYGKYHKHRGVSHTWLLGPLLRLLYLLPWLLLLALPLYGLLRWLEVPLSLPAYPQQALGRAGWGIVGMVAGYYLSQWLHLFVDRVAPNHGRRLRKRRAKQRRLRRYGYGGYRRANKRRR